MKIVCNAHATIAHASIARCDIFVCAFAVCSTTQHITRLQNNNNTKKYVRSGRVHSFWRSLSCSPSTIRCKTQPNAFTLHTLSDAYLFCCCLYRNHSVSFQLFSFICDFLFVNSHSSKLNREIEFNSPIFDGCEMVEYNKYDDLKEQPHISSICDSGALSVNTLPSQTSSEHEPFLASIYSETRSGVRAMARPRSTFVLLQKQ